MFDFLTNKKNADDTDEEANVRELCEEAEKYIGDDEPKKAEKLYLRAFSELKKLYSESPDEYRIEFAECCDDLGETLQTLEKYADACSYYQISAEIYDALSEDGDIRFKELSADSKLNIGDTFFFRDKYEEAEKNYLLALSIYEELYQKEGGGFIEDVAYCHDCLAKAFSGNENYTAAIGSYEKVISTYEKLLADEPDAEKELQTGRKYDLARACADVGYAYSCTGDLEDAEKYYLRAADLFRELALIDREEYADELISQYQDLSILYSDMKRPELADEYKKKYKNSKI